MIPQPKIEALQKLLRRELLRVLSAPGSCARICVRCPELCHTCCGGYSVESLRLRAEGCSIVSPHYVLPGALEKPLSTFSDFF